MLSASQSLPPQRSDILKAEQDDTTRQLLAHVPNSLIYFDHTKNMPATKEFLGVVLFADISGFTKLTECYSTLETSADGTSGTDKLSATLNAYIGKIVEEIIQSNGDILKFAGDAILATWKCSDIGHNAKALLNKVINCSIDIQKKCHNFVTEVGIVLCVKLAIAVGPMCLTFVGLPTDKEFDLSGDAVDDVGLTEKQATPGAVILSQLAWANCDQSLFDVTPLKNNRFFKIIGHSQNNSKPEQIGDDETRGNNTLLQTINRSVTSPLDSLIDQVLDYTQDMPKALMLDEDEKVTTDIYLTQTVIEASKKEKDKKKNKFDRLTMTSNLTSSEIDNLRAYVATPVLDKLDNGQNLDWLSEMRQVSVLFINMKLPEPAHDASKALQKAFEVVNEACSKFQGNLNKLFGFDKGCTFVVIFGLPGQKHEDDPVRALKCALAIFDSLHSIQEIINESIGVTTGLAFTGVVGHKDRHEYTVIGSKVNMAARLMMFYPGLLTCDAETYEASKSRLRKHDFAVQPYIELKGMKDPGVVREYNPNSGKKDDEDDFDFPILGRKKELDQIDRLFEEHKHNVKSHVIVIEGDAGIGKTRLLEQIMDEGEKRRFRVIYVEGDLAQAQTSGYISNTVIKLIFELDSLERDFLFNAFKDDDEIMENLNLIKDLLGLASSSNIRIDQSENHNPDRYHYRRKMILKVITILSVQQPCLIAIDNARYIDEKSWSFFKDLAQQTQCMMAFSIRTMTSSPLSPIASDMIDSTNALRLDLAGLGQQYVVDFICQLLQVCEIPKKLHELIQKKSQGVPSWCEQLIKDALYANTIQVIAKPITEDQELSKPGHPDYKAFNKDFMNSHNFEVPISRPGSRRESTSQQQQRSSKTPKFDVLKNLTITSNKLEDQFVYKPEEYVSATEGVVPGENDEICIITPGADLKSVLQPDSVKDMVLARMDRMSLNEQTVLKCAAVLGQSFTRDLLTAIIPKNCVNMLDTTLYNLCKQQFFECGSLQLQSAQQRSQSSHTIMLENKTQQHHYHHHHGHGSIQNTQVLCACYSFEGYPLINLSQSNNYSDRKNVSVFIFISVTHCTRSGVRSVAGRPTEITYGKSCTLFGSLFG
uniref:Guanylate cyclase domain-containing protein n=2 Tax=Clytia hemisphaerica TaxID=252671 RepID=A0A7M5XBN8_9CNID